MRGFLLGAFGAGRFDILGDVDDFSAQANRAQLSRIGLDFLSFETGVEADLRLTQYYRQQFCLNGNGESFTRSTFMPLSRTQSGVLAPDVEVRTRVGSSYQALILRADPAALVRQLESLLGRHANKAIDFNPNTTLDNAAGQHLKRSALFLAYELDSLDADPSDLALKEYEDYLLLLFLKANAHNYSNMLRAPERESAPWQVRVTEDFLAANWNKAVTIEEIARGAGVTARSIFKSFKKSRGYSPMIFLKDVRLKKAQEMLRRAEAGVTVATVADQCGFLSHGHFSRDYHRHFGEFPSATLRRAQGRG